jgi:hypothetical protein
MKLLFRLFVTICLNIPFLATAQHYLGVETDGWNGMNTLYLNPANIAGREERLIINLFSVNMMMDNSLGTLNSTTDVTGTFYGKKYNPLFGNTNTLNMLAPATEVRGPGVMYRINSSNCIALTTGIRGVNQFINFDPSLYTALTHPDQQFGSYATNTKNFSWMAHSWSEVGLSYGTVFSRGTNQWNIGATVRYLGGIGYTSVKGINLDVSYSATSDSIHIMNSDLEYSSSVSTANDVIKNRVSASDMLSQFFGTKGGSGIGGDFGISYFYRPSRNEDENPLSGNGYKMRISGSVTDFGIITYKATGNNIVSAKGEGFVTARGLADNLKDITDFKNYIAKESFIASPASADTKMYLPATAILSVDYQVYQHFYINATGIMNIMDRSFYGNTYYDRIAIIPRYDSRLIGVSIPITSSMLAHDMKVGLGLRVTGIFVGSDDMMALFSNNQHGFNFYAGAYFPIYKKRVKFIAESSAPAPKAEATPKTEGAPKTGVAPKKETK